MTTFNQAMSVPLRAVAGWSRVKKVVLLLVLAALPLYLGPVMAAIGTVVPLNFFQAGERYMFRVLDQAGIYILLALGLNVVVGYAGLLDLGYVAFYAIGAYSYALLASPQLGLHIPFWVVLPLAPLLAALFGVLLGAPTLRLRGDYLAIVTLGFGEVIRILLNNLDAITNGPRGVINIDPATLDPAHLDPKSVATAKLLLYPKLPDLIHNLPLTLSSPVQYYYLVLILCIGAVFFSYRLEGSRIGRAWAAIREDEDAAQTMGINKTTTKLLAFAMGASTAGFSGVIFSSLQGFVSPESFILLESITILAMIVLGGMGSIPGVVLGAIILVVVPEVLREYAQYRLTIFGLGLTLMMLVRPQGLWPVRVRPSAMPDAADTGPEPTSERAASRVELLPGAIVESSGAPRAGFLAIDGVSKSFGGLRAVSNVSFSVARGQLVAVIGPNGAGKTSLEALAKENPKYNRVLKQVDDMSEYLSACQFGITLASLGIGFLGEPALAELIKPIFGGFSEGVSIALAIALAYALATSLHITLGEQVPKIYAIVKAERVAIRVARPLDWFNSAMRPFIAVLNMASNSLLRLLRIDPEAQFEEGQSPSELRFLIAQAQTGGHLDAGEAGMLQGVFHLHEQEARQVMTPIPAVVTVDISEDVETALRRCISSGHTRLLVTEDDNQDRVKGTVHSNSLARQLMTEGPDASIEDLVKEALIVPETKPLDDLLADLQRHRSSMAVVIDEYGRVAGIVTVEDIIEEVVGEIDDETDPAGGEIRRLANGDWFVRGHVAITDLLDYGLTLPVDTDAYNSIGGFVFAELGRLPKRGDTVSADGYSIRVESVRENRIEAVRIRDRRGTTASAADS